MRFRRLRQAKRPKALIGAGLVIALIGHNLSAQPPPVSETVTEVRAQFDYGRDLVMGCRYTVHDTRQSEYCKSSVLFPSLRTKVTNAMNAGAVYQMMKMEQEAGVRRGFNALLVRDDVKNHFDGDSDRYCFLWDVECEPVKAAIAAWAELGKQKTTKPKGKAK